MQIPRFQNPINFKGAMININALSDTHGHLELADSAYQAMCASENDVFIKDGAGKQSYLIIGGDWGMSGDTKGFLSNPKKPQLWFQKQMLNKFISEVKKQTPKTKVLFTPGNHDLDCGIKLFKNVMNGFSGKILMTNLDFQNSPEFSSLIEKGKIIASQVDFVKDDKDKNKTHAILNIGISPVNMDYYGNTEGIKLIDNGKIAQKDVSQQFYKKTLDRTKEIVDEFREQYPNGTVILTCHTGAGFADSCANYITRKPDLDNTSADTSPKTNGIDLIFDAHEHKDGIRFVNGTPIVSLSENFKKIVNAKITIDDSGKEKNINCYDIRPTEQKQEGELGVYYRDLFKEDSQNRYSIICDNAKLTKLDTENVRIKNNHLANFVCDILLESVKKKDPSIQIFALNSSSIRGGFKLGDEPQVSMFNVINCLSGINRYQADIYVNEVTGEELAELIQDNFNFNAIEPSRNTIIQYSGIRINKTKFMKAQEDMSRRDLCQFITLEETNEPINPDKTYKIANPEKYFVKTKNNKIQNMLSLAYPLKLNVRDIFNDYFKNNPQITFETKTRLY